MQDSRFDMQPSLAGPTLSLSPMRRADYDGLYGAARDPLIWAGHPAKDRHLEDVFRPYFGTLLASGGTLVVRAVSSGEILGCSRYYVAPGAEDDISIGFTGRSGATLPVLRNIDLAVTPGESVGLVGESGSGKSTLALAAMGYLKRGLRLLGGSAEFKGHDMFGIACEELERIRGGQLALIPQNSGQSLTPTLRIALMLPANCA